MGAKKTKEDKSFGLLVIDKDTKELKHFSDNTNLNISETGNWGIYFFSVRIFTEFGLSTF